MNLLQAKQTAAKLFGPGLKLHRGKNRCFVIRDGMPIGDGSSWLEALRSAGEMQMAKNAMADAEAERVKTMIQAFRVAHPDIDPSKNLTEEQLKVFDAFVEKYENQTKHAPDCCYLLDDDSDHEHLADAGTCTCGAEPTSAIPEIKRIAPEEAGPPKPLVTLK